MLIIGFKTSRRVFFSGFFQVGKGKKRIFPGGEKRKSAGILPKKHAILRVKKLKKPLFVENFRGGRNRFQGEFSPCPAEISPDEVFSAPPKVWVSQTLFEDAKGCSPLACQKGVLAEI